MHTQYIEQEDGGMLCVKSDTSERMTTKADGDGKTPIVLLISTEAIDSDGDIIHQRRSKKGSGWVLKRFNGGPVVTWQHNMWEPNLSGKDTKAKVGNHPRKGPSLFLNPLMFDDGDPFAMSLDGKIRRDVIKESSVSFKTIEKEARRTDEGRTIGWDIYGAELYEVAIANRGANPETEVLAKRMMARPDLAGTVEGSGSAEIEELKAEIENLHDEIKKLSDSLCQLGDRVGVADQAKILATEERVAVRKVALHIAASQILGSLQKAGTAHGS